MKRPKVKICGITRVEDALEAVDAGADFIGFVFAKASPRYVGPDAVRKIVRRVRSLWDHVSCVGVFVDEDPGEANRIVRFTDLDLVQLHGREPASDLDRIFHPVIRAMRVRDELPDLAGWERTAWILYDTYARSVHGGTGRTFDWSLLTKPRAHAFFLSGGLNARNVAKAIRTVQPDAIDVSSGVEDAPGIKSAKKIRALFAAIEGVEQ